MLIVNCFLKSMLHFQGFSHGFMESMFSAHLFLPLTISCDIWSILNSLTTVLENIWVFVFEKKKEEEKVTPLETPGDISNHFCGAIFVRPSQSQVCKLSVLADTAHRAGFT